MEEKTSIVIDYLDKDMVWIKKQKYAVVENEENSIGNPWRVAYDNSVNGRISVEKEVEEPYKTAIFALWGDSPTVQEKTLNTAQ